MGFGPQAGTAVPHSAALNASYVCVRMDIPQVKRRITNIGFAAGAVGLSLAMVLLLPILIPAIAIGEAWEVRRLARTRCVRCGHPIGLAEISRAKREGIAEAWSGKSATPAVWRRRRIVAVWQVTCPTCGRTYTYGPNRALGLVSTDTAAKPLPNN